MTDTKTTAPAATERLTQAERRDRSGRELIQAAIRVVSRGGVAAATFDTIGREAGFSRGLVTQRFGSKEGLIRALIAHLHDWQGDVLEAGNVDGMSGLEALCLFVLLHCESMRGSPEGDTYFMLLSAAVADRLETRTAFAESHEVERALIRGFIERGQAGGDILPGIDADAEALLIGCALLGMRMQSLIDPAFDAGPVRDELVASIRTRLRPAGKGRKA